MTLTFAFGLHGPAAASRGVSASASISAYAYYRIREAGTG